MKIMKLPVPVERVVADLFTAVPKWVKAL